MIQQHLYVVDMIRDVVQSINESMAGKFTDWDTTGVLPSYDGLYRIKGYESGYQSVSGLLVKNGDIIKCEDRVATLANAVNYNYGHPVEIAATLMELSKSELTRDSRYPLLALITDFSEQKDSADYYCKVRLNFILANTTNPTYKSDERTEISFKSVLHPIYEQLIEQLKLSKHFIIEYDQHIPHTKVDRYFWGRNNTYDKAVWDNLGVSDKGGNIFGDYLDVVEIVGLELKVNKQFNSNHNLNLRLS